MSGFNDEHSEFDHGGTDPMLEQRVERLEDGIKEIQKDVGELKLSFARIEGRLEQMPDASSMWRMVVGTWIAGAGIVILAVKLLQT